MIKYAKETVVCISYTPGAGLFVIRCRRSSEYSRCKQTAAAVVVLSILPCRQDVAACVVFIVMLLKIAVMSQHLRRVVVVAASVLGVREVMAVVWSRAAVVPGEASVRSFIVQKTSVGATVVVLVYRPWRKAVDVSSAVEVVVRFPLPVFVVPRSGRWPASRFHFWCSCRFRSNVKVPSSVTSLSCRSLARLPSSRNCFSKGVKPERFRLTASEKSSRTYIGGVTLSSLLSLSTSRCLKDWNCTETAEPTRCARSICTG